MNHTLGTSRCAWASWRRWRGVCRPVPLHYGVKESDLVVVLSFYGEADGRMLLIEVIQEIVHVVPFYDGVSRSWVLQERLLWLVFQVPPCKSQQWRRKQDFPSVHLPVVRRENRYTWDRWISGRNSGGLHSWCAWALYGLAGSGRCLVSVTRLILLLV